MKSAANSAVDAKHTTVSGSQTLTAGQTARTHECERSERAGARSEQHSRALGLMERITS